ISLILFAWRAPQVGIGGRFNLLSRESALLTNNVLLVVAAGAVLLGTLYPLLLDALDMGKISVGPPYFDAVFVPLMVPALFLMAVGPMARWKQADIPDIARRLRWAAAISVIMGILMPVIMGEWAALRSLGFALAFWIWSSVFIMIRERVQKSPRTGNVFSKIVGLPNAFLGMCVAHSGVAVFIIGVAMVQSYEIEKDMRMEVGDTVELGGYVFQFEGVTRSKGPNYSADRGQIVVSKDGEVETVLFPEKRTYTVQTMPMTEAAIDTGLTRDLYVSLGEPVSNGAWSVRLYYKPFVDWIWAGAFIMAMGGLLAVSDRRYRLVSRRVQEKPGEENNAVPAGNAVPGES
ncbi:MAG: cytochrome c-type biogenesis CcmF C-terminal domain-containing protein, partial [Gammaproteobacteria bacterium]